MRPVVTVAVLIRNQEDILLTRSTKWKKHWGLPAGKVEYGEHTRDATIREAKEETGLDIMDVNFLILQEIIHPEDFHEDTHFVSVNYMATAKTRDVKLNDEADEYCWARPDECLGMDLNKPTRELLEEYI